jgi:hypothetical protein
LPVWGFPVIKSHLTTDGPSKPVDVERSDPARQKELMIAESGTVLAAELAADLSGRAGGFAGWSIYDFGFGKVHAATCPYSTCRGK